jgi:hypothetical protein
MVTFPYMDEVRARRMVDSLRDPRADADLLRGGTGIFGIRLPAWPMNSAGISRQGVRGIMTPQQRALVAELRAADYPAAWKLSASASDDKLVAGAAQVQRSAHRRSALVRTAL